MRVTSVLKKYQKWLIFLLIVLVSMIFLYLMLASNGREQGVIEPIETGRVGDMTQVAYFNKLGKLGQEKAQYERLFMQMVAVRFYVVMVIVDIVAFLIYTGVSYLRMRDTGYQELVRLGFLIVFVPALAYLFNWLSQTDRVDLFVQGITIMDRTSAYYISMGFLGLGSVASMLNGLLITGKPLDNKDS